MSEQHWPKWEEKYLVATTVTVIIQINGKVRDKIEVDAGASEEEVKKLALASEKINTLLAGSVPKQFIYVPGKVLNIVV